MQNMQKMCYAMLKKSGNYMVQKFECDSAMVVSHVIMSKEDRQSCTSKCIM